MTCAKCVEQHMAIQRLHDLLARAHRRIDQLEPPERRLAPVTADGQDFFRRAVHALEQT